MNIGDIAYFYDTKSNQTAVPCPDCATRCFHTVTLGCGEVITIECENCKRGYENASGYVYPYQMERLPDVKTVEIIGIRIENGKTEYQSKETIGGRERYFGNRVSKTYEEAFQKAEEEIAVYNKQEMDRYKKRFKEGRTWSWHASYHRKCLKDAERQAEYHKKALDWANARKRES